MFGVFREPLAYLFQLSLEKGSFPDDLKIAKVTPIHKTGDNSDIINYKYRFYPAFLRFLNV